MMLDVVKGGDMSCVVDYCEMMTCGGVMISGAKYTVVKRDEW